MIGAQYLPPHLKTGRAQPDPTRRGTGGLVFVQSAPDPNPIAPAMVEGARSIGMPAFDSNNGRLMEGGWRSRYPRFARSRRKRLSVFRTYVFPTWTGQT